MFKNYNYFFSVSFKWGDMLPLLGIQENQWKNFEFNKEVYFSLFGVLPDKDMDEAIGDVETEFEYYVLPCSIKNGPYRYSTVYDQQTKRFSESGKNFYGALVRDKEQKTYISCFFSKFSKRSGMSVFSVSYTKGNEVESLSFWFDSSWLNLKDSRKIWQSPISYEVTNYEGKTLSIDSKIFTLYTSVQSKLD
jgi:hypothetical protein